MIFNNYSNLKDRHSFLSPSKYHWINYTEEKLRHSFTTYQASVIGTRLHEFAKECILLGQKLPKAKKTLNLFVNDAIGFKMSPEVCLYYSDNCFGTTDAISFRHNVLHIHDLKTGYSKTSMNQCLVYSAIFCLEYKCNPKDIEIELRIYQNNEVVVYIPNFEEISNIMNKIKLFDKMLQNLK